MNRNKLAFVVVLFLIVFATTPSFGQCLPTSEQSPKPESIKAILAGISSYNFLNKNKDNVSFIEAYFIEELKKWMEVVRPGILFGTDYSKSGPEHIYIAYGFSANPYWAYNGVLWWNVNDIQVHFKVNRLDYQYVFTLPNFSVQSNDFSDHSLYQILLKQVNEQIYQYDKSCALHLAEYSSGWNESSIKSSFQTDGCRLFEGIYEDVASDNGHKDNKYKLAMKYIDERPCLIYLGGAWLFNDWKEGEYKAWLEPTATPNIFKAQWLMADKTISSVYISFADGSMRVSFSSDDSVYIKLYPTASDDITVDRNHTGTWTGTGFALKNGYIVTNFHVIDSANSIEVHGVNGDISSNYKADIIATDKKNDLAIIQIVDTRFKGFGNIPYSVKSKMLDVGEDVWVLGYPMTQVLGNEIKLTNGVVSSRSGYQGDVSTYQISAPVQPGNSGGPLFDAKGNVVGIVNAGVPGAENVGYAIKTSYLKNLIDSFSLTSSSPGSNTISSMTLKDRVKSVNKYVFLLICSSK